MDYTAVLHGWVTTGSHSTSLLHEYDYLPRPHRVIRLNTPVNSSVLKRLGFALLVGIPLNVMEH